MKRQIIKIDEDKCNGCGQCATSCAEGAIQMVDGKARLVSEVFCDGLGACLGECPVGAITIEERDAVPYSERETMEKLLPQGMKVVRLHLEHLKNHGQQKLYEEGVAVLQEKGIEISTVKQAVKPRPTPVTLPLMVCPSSSLCGDAGEVKTNWPIQLQLINPDSAVFDDADLVIAADCTAFAYSNFYREFTVGKALIVFCPKLDHATDMYVEKLAAIFSQHSIRSITLLRMLVPCCGGTAMIVKQALVRTGKDISVSEYVVNFDGTLR